MLSRAPARAASACALGFVLLVVFASAAGAEERRGASVRIPAGTTVHEDLHILAGRAVVTGNVAGNLSAVAGYLDVVGSIGGAVTAVGGRVEIRGPVDGGITVTGASVALYGDVGGDVIVTGGSITVVEGSTIWGDLVLAGASTTIVAEALVAGDVRGTALDLTIEGEVGRDVRVTARQLGVAPSARIGGALRYESRVPAAIAPGAAVAGPVVRVDPARRVPLGGILFWRGMAVPRVVAMLIVGTALIVLAPRRVVASADRGRSDPRGILLAGAGLALFLPVLLLVLALAVVTLPLALIGGIAYLALVYPSQAIVGLALGRAVLGISPDNARRGANLVAMAAGTSGLAVLRLTPVPYISLAIAVLTAAAGLGMFARSGLAGAPGPGDTRSPASPAGVLAALTGGLVGFTGVVAALVALILASAAMTAAVLVASNQASLAWTVAPGRLAAVASIFGGVALACAVAVLATIRRRCPGGRG